MTLSSVSEHDVTSNRYLRGKYSICGVGETTYRRGSAESTRSLATWAISNAMKDAGMDSGDIDGMLSYSGNDSTSFYIDILNYKTFCSRSGCKEILLHYQLFLKTYCS